MLSTSGNGAGGDLETPPTPPPILPPAHPPSFHKRQLHLGVNIEMASEKQGPHYVYVTLLTRPSFSLPLPPPGPAPLDSLGIHLAAVTPT